MVIYLAHRMVIHMNLYGGLQSRQDTPVFLRLTSTIYQKDLSQIRPTEAESVETRIIILFSSVVALKRSLFDTGSNPTSESVVKPFAEREECGIR